MIVARSQKQIELTPEARAALGIDVATIDPASLISAILKAPIDLLWFGGIGTYIKASHQTHAQVGDPANDALRVDARDVRASVIGEGANLAINQAGRIEFSIRGGRINTDFIDNSAGVDCSDNEVNIKIALNREVREGRLAEDKRNVLLASMTEDVSELVLEDNRLQSLALSVAEARGAKGLPGFVRTIEMLEATGRLDRNVEGLEAGDVLLRRGAEGRGLTRPELAVVLSMAKLTLQSAAEELTLADDPTMDAELMAAFPKAMQAKHGDAIRAHRLRHQIVATKIANRIVNRLGPSVAFDMTEEEGVGLPQVITAFLVLERLFDLGDLWAHDRACAGRRADADPVVRDCRAQCAVAPWRRDSRRGGRHVRRGGGGDAPARAEEGRGQGQHADPRRSARRIGGAARAAREARRGRGDRRCAGPPVRARRGGGDRRDGGAQGSRRACR